MNEIKELEGLVEIVGEDFIRMPKHGDAGIDLIASEDPTFNLEDGEVKYIEYATGVRVAPNNSSIHGFIFPRSSISNYDLILANSVAVIDSSYRGEIKLRFRVINPLNFPKKERIYQKGDKIAQLIFLKTPCLTPVSVDKFEKPDTVRGEGGFGSTGK